jgi:hypothetical protein
MRLSKYKDLLCISNCSPIKYRWHNEWIWDLNSVYFTNFHSSGDSHKSWNCIGMAVVIPNFCTEIEETHEKSHNNRHRCRIASTNTNRRRASFYNSVAYYLQVFGRRQLLIRTFTYTVYIYPYKKPRILCLDFQVQYTFGPLYSFLVRGLLTGIIFIRGYFRSLFFLTDGCGPLLRHPELPDPPYFTCRHWENSVHWLENAIQKVG